MRLNRFLALAGLGSRRSTEALIREQRVSVNGRLCENLGTNVGETDQVKVDGRAVRPETFSYILFYKPRGYEVTRGKTGSSNTIYHLLPRALNHLAHVGRLDVDSEGLLLLTNDGELAQKISHPRFKLEKEYLVKLDRPFDLSHLPRVLRGVYLSDGRARFEKVVNRGNNRVGVILTQGMNRQIRRVFAALNYKVRELVRVRIGSLTRSGLAPGQFRKLKSEEIRLLKSFRPAASPVSANRPDPHRRASTGSKTRPEQPSRVRLAGGRTATTNRGERRTPSAYATSRNPATAK